MTAKLRVAYKQAIHQAKQLYAARDYEGAFHILERAHILGQRHFLYHLESHWWMLKVGLRVCDLREIVGQVLRIFAVVPGFLFFWVPVGNTGGANVSAIKPMSVPKELESYLPKGLEFSGIVYRLVSWVGIVWCGLILRTLMSNSY